MRIINSKNDVRETTPFPKEKENFNAEINVGETR